MPGTPATFLIEHWFIALLFANLVYAARKRLSHGLQKFPGSFLASFTD